MMTESNIMSSKLKARFWYGLFLMLFSTVFRGVVNGQDVSSADFQVTQLAADQVFMEWRAGLAEDMRPETGDTLYLYRDTDFAGALKVIGLNPPGVAGVFLDEPFAITRGEIFIVRWSRPEALRGKAVTEEDSLAAEARVSLLARKPAAAAGSIPGKKLSVTGRVMSGANLRYSETFWSSVLNKSDRRWSSTPYINLNLNVDNLPYQWEVNLQGRYSYRLQTESDINQTGLLNLYNFYAARTWEKIPLEFQIGRFYNRYESGSSYWDGLMFHYRGKHWGAGTTAGLEPDRSNEGLETKLPKAGVFVHYNLRGEETRWFGNFSFTSLFPADFSTQYYAGIEQKLDYKALSFDGEVQTGYDPESGSWKLTRLQLRTGLEITRWFEISSSYNERTPYLLMDTRGIFLDSRYRYGLNTTVRLGKWQFYNGVNINRRLSFESVTYNTRIQWYQSPVWKLSWNAFGSLWKSDDGSNWNAGLYLSRSLDNIHLSTGAGAYRSLLLDSDHLSGSFYLNGSVAFSRSLSLNTRIQSSIGDLMSHNSLSVSLWKTF